MQFLDHIAILTPKLESMVLKLHLSLRLSREDLGDIAEHSDMGTREAYIGQEGLSHRILVIEPTGNGTYRDALKKRGESVHHISLKASKIEKATEPFEASNWQMHIKSMRFYKEVGTIFLFQPDMPLIEIIESPRLKKPAKSFLNQLTLPGSPRQWAPLQSELLKTTRKPQATLRRAKGKFSI